jgi:hypothetical protein
VGEAERFDKEPAPLLIAIAQNSQAEPARLAGKDFDAVPAKVS